ncbi:lipase [Usnea florida]
MIDHVLGRPSVQFRKIQVFAVVSFWSLYLLRGNSHGPPILRRLSVYLSKRLTGWQTVVITLLYLYICRNFAKLFALESPEPLANLYSRSYFRATWITTALDAGFWTAMKIRRKWLRDLASIIFTGHYLLAAEQADEKVRKVRGTLTVDHLRVSWNKSTTPYLSFITKLTRPKLARYPPRAIRIPRPAESSYKEPINAWLYFDGPISALKNHTKVILDFPGGGYVAMTPRHHDDKLMAWSGKTGLPVLSLDYRKAPEYPYPYALNECYDVYHTLVVTQGRCIGLAGQTAPRIVLTGDSAGGNFATGVVLMILQSAGTDPQRWHGQESLPAPEGLILIYPSLDMNIGNWMTDDQMALIQDQRTRKTNRDVLRRKSEDYYRLTPETPLPSDDEAEERMSPERASADVDAIDASQRSDTPVKPPTNKEAAATVAHHTASLASSKPKVLKTRLAVSSMISYFNDRILTPEMMRAMIILYVGPHNRPDFSTDYLLSPLLAPEALLAHFPKTFFLTGERDPLVDDTVIFAGRLRQAKHNMFVQKKELSLLSAKDVFDERDHVEVALIPGISHGFLQFVGIFPEAWGHVFRCARWVEEVFDASDGTDTPQLTRGSSPTRDDRHHHRAPTESSGDEESPLMMSSLGGNGHAPKPPKRGKGRRVRHQDGDRRKNRSMVSLASEDDLLGRRMKGLTGGLMGITSGTQTP